MTSKFYEPALHILKSAHGRKLSPSEVKTKIIELYPDIEWSETAGPIRAMLLSASNSNTPIRRVPDIVPPMFYYEECPTGRIDVPSAGPEEMIERAYFDLENKLKAMLLEKILSVTPYQFEDLVNKLIKKLGFGNRIVPTPHSHDFGIDGKIYGDCLDLNVVCVQAKQYKVERKVTRPEMDSFVGALGGRNGIFVTTSDFVKPAREKANYPGTASRIALINGEKLVSLMISYNLGVQDNEKQYVLHHIDHDFFEGLEG